MADRTDELIEQALRFPADQQSAFLEGACGEDNDLRRTVEARLRENKVFVNQSVDRTCTHEGAQAGQQAGSLATNRKEEAGESIGRYKLLQEIGEGGFGSVFMAEQREPVKRRVALKIIKLGMDTRQVIARFEAERQALAMMDHPNIARVLDAGATDTGRPYFVMELVKGMPITEYCDRNSLTVRNRLELMIPVCHAIQHAHQKGIIHRDIKPSNVLVTLHDGKPVPKVIDFGIAKATNTELTNKTLFTEFKQFIGTPLYMSPEQAEMSGLDIDTRSDVYSLGVLLYELVTDSTPCTRETIRGKNFMEIQRMIAEQEPVSPSTRLSSSTGNLEEIAKRRNVEPSRLSGLIRGELDWIALKALEKDRTRRYSSARDLADDIERFLKNEPIAAAPPSRLYQVRKAVRRHRALFAMVGTFAAALLVAAVGATWGMLRAIDAQQSALAAAQSEGEQRMVAEANAREAAAAREQAEAEANRALAAEQRAQERAAELLRMTEFQAAMMQNLNVGQMGDRMREAVLVEIRSAMARESDAVTSTGDNPVEAQIAELEKWLKRANFTNPAVLGIEENILSRAGDQIDKQFADQPLIMAQLLQNVGEARSMLGIGDAAQKTFQRVYEIRRETLGEQSPETIAALAMWGIELHTRYGYSGNTETIEKALEESNNHLGSEHPLTRVLGFTIQGNLDPIFQEGQSDLVEWWAMLTPGLTPKDAALVAEVTPQLMQRLAALGLTDELGRSSLPDREVATQALVVFEEFLANLQNQMADTHPLLMQFRFVAGRNAFKLGLPERAERLIRDALTSQRHALGDNHPNTQLSVMLLIEILEQLNQQSEASQLAELAIDFLRKRLGENHPALVTPLQVKFRHSIASRDWTEAKQTSEKIVSIVRPVQANQPEKWADGLASISSELLEAEIQETESAREIYRILELWMQECLELRQMHAPDNWTTANARSMLGTVQFQRVRTDDSLSEEQQGELLEKSQGNLIAGLEQLKIAESESSTSIISQRRQQAAARLVQLYDFLHQREPNAGHDLKSAQIEKESTELVN